MKIPKTVRKFCPTCKNYTEHRVAESKRKTPGSKHPMGYGSKIRARRRGVRGTGNMGKYSKPPIKRWKMAGKKQSKKVDLRFTCSVCKKTQITSQGWRARKVEIV